MKENWNVKEILVDRLMQIAFADVKYDLVVRPSDQIKALNILANMLGHEKDSYNDNFDNLDFSSYSKNNEEEDDNNAETNKIGNNF